MSTHFVVGLESEHKAVVGVRLGLQSRQIQNETDVHAAYSLEHSHDVERATGGQHRVSAREVAVLHPAGPQVFDARGLVLLVRSHGVFEVIAVRDLVGYLFVLTRHVVCHVSARFTSMCLKENDEAVLFIASC